MIYLDEHRFNFNPRPDPLDRALDTARRAVASDPTSQWAHHALAQAHFYRHELDAFLAEAERVLELNPNNAGILAMLGDRLHWAGDDRGIVLVERAKTLDPFHPTWLNITFARNHFDKGEYEEALAAARKINLPGHFFGLALLAAIYAELGRQSEARSALGDLLKLWPGLTAEQWTEHMRKWNYPDERIRHMVAALRKAGLPD
jgi:tetratricopeptide (TPR) repeat protein